jgi:hypothetical protein
LCAVVGLAGSIAFAFNNGFPASWQAAIMAAAAIALLLAFALRPHPLLLGTALAITVAYSASPLMLHQNIQQIAASSPLEGAVRANLPTDARYAILSPGLQALPPNLNAAIGLSSVHSYNSLSSQRYRTLLKELGADASAFGRWNDAINPDLNSVAFWMSNIAVVLAPAPLPPTPALEYVGQFGEAYLYRVLSRMGCCLQVPLLQSNIRSGGSIDIAPAAIRSGLPVAKTSDQGDMIQFDVPAQAASILVLSQKYHRDWHAQALTAHGWVDVPTGPVNDIFQGAALPEGARQARFRFEPYARFAWIAHVFWLIALLILAVPLANRRLFPAIVKGGSFEK